MSELLPFIVMSSLEAARFRDATAGDMDRLEPVEIVAGPHKGKFALPARVKTDPAFEDRWDAFAMCDEVALDVSTAFPTPEARGI